MGRNSNDLMLRIFAPHLIVSFVYISIAFLLHFGQDLNMFGIGIFLVYALLFNLLWVGFFVYMLEVVARKQVHWAWKYLIWLISVAFYSWALYDKTLVSVDFYADILVLATAALLFFRDKNSKSWQVFALAIMTAYLYYASLSVSVFFYVLIMVLVIDGLLLDSMREKGGLSTKEVIIYFSCGIGYFAAMELAAGLVKKIFF